MSTKRRTRRRDAKRGLTPEAIAAWHACDYNSLHCALGLHPHEQSPLPEEIIALGVSEDDPPAPNSTSPWDQSYSQALELQRKLLAAAGWPADCRRVYEENLKEAKDWARYCAELVKYPDRGGMGTGCDPASRARKLKEAQDDVAYRRRLLDDLDKAKT